MIKCMEKRKSNTSIIRTDITMPKQQGKTTQKSRTRTLTIPRTTYKRKKRTEAHTKEVRGKEIEVPSYEVEKTQIMRKAYEREDVGAPGRGKKILPSTKKTMEMTMYAIELGFITEDQKIKDIPNSKIDEFALGLANELQKPYKNERGKRKAVRRAVGMFQKQANIRKGRKEKNESDFRTKMQLGANAIRKQYHMLLTPVEAIKKWKGMIPQARKKVMPERKGKKGYKPVKEKRVHPKTGTVFQTTVWKKIR